MKSVYFCCYCLALCYCLCIPDSYRLLSKTSAIIILSVDSELYSCFLCDPTSAQHERMNVESCSSVIKRWLAENKLKLWSKDWEGKKFFYVVLHPEDILNILTARLLLVWVFSLQHGENIWFRPWCKSVSAQLGFVHYQNPLLSYKISRLGLVHNYLVKLLTQLLFHLSFQNWIIVTLTVFGSIFHDMKSFKIQHWVS